jgi:NAD-dependent SIR2 family protein deacetylase
MDNKINMQLNPDDLQDVNCAECEGTYFTPSFMMKKVSALQSPTGQQMVVPVQIFRCDNCGEVLHPHT